MLYSVVYRNRWILYIDSVCWEILQFAVASTSIFHLQWIGQCWYHSLIFNVLMTNLLGIEVGHWTMHKLNAFEWYNMTISEGLTPFKLVIVIWNSIVLFQLEQLLSFILFDHTFWYRSDGWIIWCRSVIYILCSAYAMNQLFYWVREKAESDTKRSGARSLYWVFVLNLLVFSELLLAIKTYSADLSVL